MRYASRTGQPTPAITYSPAYTLVPTYECFNQCSYCNFRVSPGTDEWLSLEQARDILRALRGQGVIEILILSGEVHPHSPRRVAWIDHIVQLCQLALDLDFLPHTNAGPLSLEEMTRLKAVNVSMGLMLEQVTPRLMQTVHRHAPSKDPQRRLQQLEWAGQLRIPFTTGLLLGIGETPQERVETLTAIAHLHTTWGHIQEVILQPHSPGTQQAETGQPFEPEQLVDIVAIAREILPDSITLQIPPNLISQPDVLLRCLEAGARDLGGLGPRDEVNPDYPHPDAAGLTALLQPADWSLQPRLPVYPHYDDWLSPPLRQLTQTWRQRLAASTVSMGAT